MVFPSSLSDLRTPYVLPPLQEMTAVVLTLSAAAFGIYSAKTGTGVMGRYIEVGGIDSD